MVCLAVRALAFVEWLPQLEMRLKMMATAAAQSQAQVG
jgi:hypothetical protein